MLVKKKAVKNPCQNGEKKQFFPVQNNRYVCDWKCKAKGLTCKKCDNCGAKDTACCMERNRFKIEILY